MKKLKKISTFDDFGKNLNQEKQDNLNEGLYDKWAQDVKKISDPLPERAPEDVLKFTALMLLDIMKKLDDIVIFLY